MSRRAPPPSRPPRPIGSNIIDVAENRTVDPSNRTTSETHVSALVEAFSARALSPPGATQSTSSTAAPCSAKSLSLSPPLLRHPQSPPHLHPADALSPPRNGVISRPSPCTGIISPPRPPRSGVISPPPLRAGPPPRAGVKSPPPPRVGVISPPPPSRDGVISPPPPRAGVISPPPPPRADVISPPSSLASVISPSPPPRNGAISPSVPAHADVISRPPLSSDRQRPLSPEHTLTESKAMPYSIYIRPCSVSPPPGLCTSPSVFSSSRCLGASPPISPPPGLMGPSPSISPPPGLSTRSSQSPSLPGMSSPGASPERSLSPIQSREKSRLPCSPTLAAVRPPVSPSSAGLRRLLPLPRPPRKRSHRAHREFRRSMSSPLERFSDYSRGSKRETAEAVRGSEVHFYEEQVMNDSADGEGDEKMSVCPEDESNTVYGRGESSSHSSYSVPRSTRLVSTSAKSIKLSARDLNESRKHNRLVTKDGISPLETELALSCSGLEPLQPTLQTRRLPSGPLSHASVERVTLTDDSSSVPGITLAIPMKREMKNIPPAPIVPNTSPFPANGFIRTTIFSPMLKAGHMCTYYTVHMDTNLPEFEESSVRVLKRYNLFVELDKKLRQLDVELPPLPEKKVFKFSSAVVKERLEGFQVGG